MKNKETAIGEIEKDFEKKILNSKKPVVVEFTAKWSGACQIMEPIMEDLVKKYEAEIKFYSIDRDTNSDFQKTYGLTVVPTYLIFKDGVLVQKVSGIVAREELERFVALKEV